MEKSISSIQILRGIAVSLVVLYHLKLPGFNSGFLGVDIFFVISGFLIAKMYERNPSPSSFYRKRISRLAPAYTVVLLLVCIGSFIFVQPPEYSDVVWQAIGSLLGFSNIYFWNKNSYFADLTFAPLLHFWSLSLELQYYLVFPLLFKYFSSLKKIIVLSLISGLVSYVALAISPKTAFFILPFRLWEFLIGALIFRLKYNYKFFRDTVISTRKVCVGIVLLLILIFANFVDPLSSSTVYGHPGIVTFLVCSVSAFIIVHEVSPHAQRNLPVRTLIHIGDLSYAIYLVHFPILIFAVHFGVVQKDYFTPDFIIFLIFYLGITYLLSLVLHWGIEIRLGAAFSNFKFLIISCIILFALIISVPLNAAKYSSREMLIYGALEDRSQYRCGKLNRLLNPFSNICIISPLPLDQSILLVGNSHADSIKESVVNVSHANGFNTYFMVDNNALMKSGLIATDIFKIIEENSIKKLVIHYSPSALDLPVLQQVAMLANLNRIHTYYITPIPVYHVNIPTYLLDSSDSTLPPYIFSRSQAMEKYKLHLSAVMPLANPYFHVLNSIPYICEDLCNLVDSHGRPLYFDSNHLTLSGAKLLEPLISEIYKNR
jgi:peptidoglycan/LPS O-acetylase OafA/YrhL